MAERTGGARRRRLARRRAPARELPGSHSARAGRTPEERDGAAERESAGGASRPPRSEPRAAARAAAAAEARRAARAAAGDRRARARRRPEPGDRAAAACRRARPTGAADGAARPRRRAASPSAGRGARDAGAAAGAAARRSRSAVLADRGRGAGSCRLAVPAVQGRRGGRRARHDPRGLGRRRDRRDLEQRRRGHRAASSSSSARRLAGRSGDLKAGTYHAPRGHEQHRRAGRAREGRAAERGAGTVPEGRSRARSPRSCQAGSRATTSRATRRSRAARPAPTTAPRRARPRGLPLPRHLRAQAGPPVQPLVDEQLARSSASSQGGPARAEAQEPDAYDVLTIASMVEREAQVARERPLIASVIYNRLREGIPLGIDATVRFATNNWTRAADAVGARDRSPYNTRSCTRACRPGPIGSPGLAAIQRRGQPAPTPASSSTWSSRARAASTTSPRPTPSSSATWTRYNREREARGRQVARRTADGPRSRACPACRSRHSRSPAMQNAAFAELGLDWRYVRCRCRPTLFAETVRALPGSGFRGRERDRAAQARGARRWPTR